MVTSLAADEGSMQHKLNELTDLCTHLQRHQTEMASKITAQDLEIASLKAKVKMLEDRDGGGDDPSGEDATIKGTSLETGEEAVIERSMNKGSNDTDEMVNVLTTLDAASILTSGFQVSVPPAAEVATVSIPPAGEIPTVSVPTGSGVVLTASPIFTTATVATPYSRRKEEGERFKRKGIRLEQDSAKKVKTSEEVSEEDLKEMMQLVPVEEVYVEALLLWALVKETLNIRQATSDKEKELWVELKILYEPDVEDQLWTQTQALIHDVVEWRLYDSCGVHHVLSRDQEIFMLVEREYPLRKGLTIAFPLPVMSSHYQKTFPLIVKKGSPAEVKSSHWQYKFPLPVKVVATARRLEMPLPEVCTVIEEKKKKLPVKDRWQLP
nr:hypothetical protein [Tanacetum cinerariifolium]